MIEKEKVKKIIEYMVYMYQTGQVNQSDYENYEHLAHGYKTGIEDAVQQMVDEYPELKEYGEEMLSELEILDNCLCEPPYNYYKMGDRVICAKCFRKDGVFKTIPTEVDSISSCLN